MALRGHCLWYCRRDRADFICSGTAMSSEPLRARGSAHLPPSLTLDRAPALSQLCEGEEDRQQGKIRPCGGGGGGGGPAGGRTQRGGRFRHYLVRTGVVGHHKEAETLGRIAALWRKVSGTGGRRGSTKGCPKAWFRVVVVILVGVLCGATSPEWRQELGARGFADLEGPCVMVRPAYGEVSSN
eukprot:g13863.t1